MSALTQATLATKGMSFKIDPNKERHVRGMRNLMLISGLVMAIGIVLSVTSKWTLIPDNIRSSVLGPFDGVVTTVFTASLIGYGFMRLTGKEKKKAPEMKTVGTQFPTQVKDFSCQTEEFQ